MRIGFSLAGAVVAVIVAVTATSAHGAMASEEVKHVPLGGALTGQVGDRYFGVYVPTRFGGNLTIKSSSGTVSEITGPDSKPRTNGDEIGNDQQGWFRFKVTGAEAERPYTVETSFVQTALSKRIPWNFYYWPTKSDAIHEPWAGGNARVDTMQAMGDDVMVATPGGYIAPGQDIVRAGANGVLETLPAPGDTSTWFPNLYDDLTCRDDKGQLCQSPAPMLKYDQIFGSSSRNWEAANSQNQDIQRWPGHCLGGAVASIMLNEPTPTTGSRLSRDELKALWAELGENHYNHQIGDFANEIPAGPPRPGYDMCDASVPRFHNMLEVHVRGNKQNLLGNLRAFPPRGTVNEVWNHGIGKYIATYHAVPGKGERSVRLEVEVHANSGSNLNNEDPAPADRQVRVHPPLWPRRQDRPDQPLRGRLDFRRRRGPVLPLEPPGSGADPMGRPQPDDHRRERPEARLGERRRIGWDGPQRPRRVASGQRLRGRSSPDVRRQ